MSYYNRFASNAPDRLGSLGDCVFAFALTLMVLDIFTCRRQVLSTTSTSYW